MFCEVLIKLLCFWVTSVLIKWDFFLNLASKKFDLFWKTQELIFLQSSSILITVGHFFFIRFPHDTSFFTFFSYSYLDHLWCVSPSFPLSPYLSLSLPLSPSPSLCLPLSPYLSLSLSLPLSPSISLSLPL